MPQGHSSLYTVVDINYVDNDIATAAIQNTDTRVDSVTAEARFVNNIKA